MERQIRSEMESRDTGHPHALVLLNGEQSCNQSNKKAYCQWCDEEVMMSMSAASASSSSYYYKCVEEEKCGYLAHKMCSEAPLQINHPFHRHHPLRLRVNPPHPTHFCELCKEACKSLVYRCHLCDLDFHIRCGLFTYYIAVNNSKEVDRIIMSIEKDGKQFQIRPLSKCFLCREPLENPPFISYVCRFSLHKRCAELPLQLNHEGHAQHPLLLQYFNGDHQGFISCNVCRETHPRGFLYGCSPCKYAVHVECASSSPSSFPIIEDSTSHPHPFMLLQRRVPFVCDACGTRGRNWDAYTCHTCNIMVHKKCISLPRIIRSKWHDHPLFHKYFLDEEQVGDYKSWGDCVICHNEVNIDHGSYSCLDCKHIFHVDCAKQYGYDIISLEESRSDATIVSSFTCVKRNDAGEAIEIKHIKHTHNLMLTSDKIVEEYDDKRCDGCLLPILVPFYYCSLCDFSLHKACAELPKMKHLWFHPCQQPHMLQNYSDSIFPCLWCGQWSNGFAYICTERLRSLVCLRCVIALAPGARTCHGHDHPLLYYNSYEGQCSGCGVSLEGALRCKGCNFSLCLNCFSLPIRVGHKCDKHLLTLTYHDDNDYIECEYCDICEEKRDPNGWFYHCTTCNTSAHTHCLIGNYPFIKLRTTHRQRDHLHPLILVKKVYYYPQCIECHEPCEDLAFECTESGCNYISHWEDCGRRRNRPRSAQSFI